MKSASSRTVFDIAKKRAEILRIESEMASSGFWEDKARAAGLSQELAQMKKEVERWSKLAEEAKMLTELMLAAAEDEDLSQEINERADFLEREIKTVEFELFFSGKYDKGNAVLSVYAGAGGKDAEDWAALLLRMYSRFGENKGWKTKIIHEHWGEYNGPAGWGIKNATILIEAPHAYGYLKKESGVHRLVRISPFSSQSLRHTSFVLVDVMPEFVAPEEVEIKPEDLKIDFFRSSGPGGQNVNKRETAVRITHLPTGIQVASQVERTQERNRELALELLRSRIYRFKLEQQEKERQGVRKEKVAIEWGSQIRSYVMHPYQMVKDHRTEIETSNIDAVLDGELDEFIEAEIKV
ncbi:MAG: peptide chain release factor 2 [Candidatus Sungbacteria bacterium]|nr:peptide chain release factor 2 [Candidatus Sungbacteria bacterium]